MQGVCMYAIVLLAFSGGVDYIHVRRRVPEDSNLYTGLGHAGHNE